MSEDLPAVPPDTSPVRVSDAERERVVTFLRQHCSEGRLTLDEFSDRVGLVYTATTDADLDLVTSDLPAVQAPPLSTTSPAATDSPSRRARAAEWTVSIFSGNQRRGRWRIEGQTNAVAVMGGCHLDLREAEVIGSEAVINAYAFMGGVEIVVPEGIDVVLEGFSFMGGKSARIKDVPVIPGSPLIRVRAFAFMGGIDVRSRSSKPPGSKGARRNRQRDRNDARRELHDRREELRARRDDRRDAIRGRIDARRDPSHGHLPPPPPSAPARSALAGIDTVAEDVRNEWPDVRAQVAPEGTVTIMFSDIEGFTATCDRLGDVVANELLREHYRLVRDELARHGGYEVKVHGDGFMVAFSSASRGRFAGAQAIQKSQHRWNTEHPAEPVKVRMGLHTGEAIRDADDFLGTTVNLASRIANEAQGEEILVSGLLRELCLSSGEFEFDEGTEVELRGISQPHWVYPVRYE